MQLKRFGPGILLAAVLACLCIASDYAQAQTTASKSAGSTAVLTWQAPVSNTDGTPIAAGSTITYSVYQGATKVATGLTVLTFTSAPLAVGNVCWTVTDTIGGIESAQSPQVCVAVVAPTPNPPAGLTVH